MDELETAIGFRFRDKARLREALTHSTYANEHPEAGPDNERLEFVGDAVVGLIAARLLYDTIPAGEGELSRRRAAIIRREALASLAQEIDLGRYLRLGAGQQKGDGVGVRLLADAYEALAGAVFLDGGYDEAVRCFGPALQNALHDTNAAYDWKSELQELCHRKALPLPQYSVVELLGPDHARRYRCEVVVGETARGLGEGPSKKVAEQLCAQAALAMLQGSQEGKHE